MQIETLLTTLRALSNLLWRLRFQLTVLTAIKAWRLVHGYFCQAFILCISQFHLRPAHSPRADTRPLAFFLPSMANSWGWGLFSCQIPWGGDEKRGQMPVIDRTVEFLMCDFLFQLINFFLCESARILDSNDSNNDMHQFMVLVLI